MLGPIESLVAPARIELLSTDVMAIVGVRVFDSVVLWWSSEV